MLRKENAGLAQDSSAKRRSTLMSASNAKHVCRIHSGVAILALSSALHPNQVWRLRIKLEKTEENTTSNQQLNCLEIAAYAS